MSQDLNYAPPLAIGGVGGSGTRIFAELLMRAGVAMGENLNVSNDNLDFTRCFKRKDWFENYPAPAQLSQAWQDFVAGQPIAQHVEAYRWGWKEPNTHLFLGALIENIRGLKYIHILRNGLDMAFSSNQGQLRNWGAYMLGTDAPLTVTPENSLSYWIAANERAIEIGQRLGNRFLLMKYEDLCAYPEREIARLFAFANIAEDVAPYAALIAPRSIGRHKQHELSHFLPSQIAHMESIMKIAF